MFSVHNSYLGRFKANGNVPTRTFPARHKQAFASKGEKKNIQDAAPKPQKRRCPSTRCLWQTFNIIQGRTEMYICWLGRIIGLRGYSVCPFCPRCAPCSPAPGVFLRRTGAAGYESESSICIRLHLFGGVCARACARLSLRLPGWVIRSCLLHHACFNISR